MKKLLAVFAAFAALSAGLLLPAVAEEETVTATVTPCTVATSITAGTVTYGTLELSPSAASPTKKNTVELTQTKTITNSGSCIADLQVKSSDATPATNWDLVACGSVAANAFGHQYKINAASDFTGA